MKSAKLKLITIFVLAILLSFISIIYMSTYTYPLFSHESGFYSDPISLEIQGSFGQKIYYTLDGSKPIPGHTGTYIYAGPIILDDASFKENVYANVTDISIYEDYNPPTEKIDKSNVIRAIGYNIFGIHGKESSRTYYVGQDKAWDTVYPDMPIIDIIIDPPALFDPINGTYLVGANHEALYAEYLANPDRYPEIPDELKNPDASNDTWGHYYLSNYKRLADLAYMDAHITYFSPTSSDGIRDIDFECPIQMKVRGGISRDNAQKGFEIILDKASTNKIHWSDGTQASTFILDSSGNETDTKVKDLTLFNLCRDLDVMSQTMYPCQVFLDGEYWGIYYINQKANEEIIPQKTGISPENLSIIRTNSIIWGTDSDLADWNNFRSMLDLDMSNDENYAAICQQLDIESLIDYVSVQTIIGNCDWPGDDFLKNYAAYRDRNESQWRYILYDLNSPSVFRDYEVEDDNLNRNSKRCKEFSSLLHNPDFRRHFATRFAAILSTCFDPSRFDNTISAVAEAIRPSMPLYYSRFFSTGNYDLQHFDDKIQSYSNYVSDRHDIMVDYLAELYSDYGDEYNVQPLVILGLNQLPATVYVEGLPIETDSYDWYGYFLTDLSVSVEVIPDDGHTFEGWMGDGIDASQMDSTNIEVVLTDSPCVLTPVID